VWYALSVGHEGRAEARWLLPKICDAGGIAKDGIGAIRVKEDQTYVQIAKAAGNKFGAMLELEPGLEMRRIEGEPSLDRPERAPRKSFDKPERRPSAPRAPRDDSWRKDTEQNAPERAPKPDYKPKPPRIVEEDSPASPPYEVAAVAERKPFVKRDEAKPYAPKPYAKREDGPAKPYPPKPYAKREDGPAKPYAPKPYAARAEGDAPKPRWKAEAGKSAGFKSHGSGSADKPARAAGFKSHAAEGKPYKPAGEGKPYKPAAEGKPYRPTGDAAPYKAKSAGAGAKPARSKPAAEGAGKPFRSKAAGTGKPPARTGGGDARDTSKRFVPPRKPKG
jgi:ATP-dependent RNA helicase DeaD